MGRDHPAHRLKASSLARAIDCAGLAPVISRARKLGERMRTENGLATATRVPERIVAG